MNFAQNFTGFGGGDNLGLALKLDASQLVSGAQQSLWRDESGFGFDFSQPSGVNQPSTLTNVQSGFSMMNLGGTHFFENNNVSFLNKITKEDHDFEIFIVFNNPGYSAESGTLFSAAQSAGQSRVQYRVAGLNLGMQANNVGIIPFNNTTFNEIGPFDTTNNVVFRNAGTSSISPFSRGSFNYANGALISSDPVRVNPGYISGIDNSRIGMVRRSNLNLDFFTGNIGEIRIYLTKLTDAQAAAITLELTTKWSV